MKQDAYTQTCAIRLLPLLEAIGREMSERSEALVRVEERIEALSDRRDRHEEASDLVAQAAAHKRELRHAREELGRLSCQVVGTTPLTMRVPVRASGAKRRSLLWQCTGAGRAQ